MKPKLKPKRCKVCGGFFSPSSTLHVVCGLECSLALVNRRRIKEEAANKAMERRQARANREKLKTRGDWLREAQAAFNGWVRARDAHLPCISCGRFHQGQNHAGHFLSTGARPNLRFDEANVNLQCQPCNTHLHGNLILYRLGLAERRGLAEVERLEADHAPRHWSIDDLKAIKQRYSAKRRELEKA